jgi:hypothetical protein
VSMRSAAKQPIAGSPEFSLAPEHGCDVRPLGRSEVGAGGSQAFDIFERGPKVFEPLVGVRTDETDAPRERIGAGACDVRGDERVEDESIGLAKTSHHRNGQVGVSVRGVADAHRPCDLAIVAQGSGQLPSGRSPSAA